MTGAADRRQRSCSDGTAVGGVKPHYASRLPCKYEPYPRIYRCPYITATLRSYACVGGRAHQSMRGCIDPSIDLRQPARCGAPADEKMKLVLLLGEKSPNIHCTPSYENYANDRLQNPETTVYGIDHQTHHNGQE